ncbi:hypothetical protein [Ralstonia solanacearum]|uniref:hypothetical protein n=1 Tax=Ralstonia solanacearum TaxID=305 RepID=UPI000506DDD5|nr:hypothetical protein [Ralstonia solanacearum]KFX26598.1 hypothetical protein KR96_23025 [Ralstonia solanacearum]
MRAPFAAMVEGADTFACRPCSRSESESIRAAIGMRIFAKIGLHFVLICLVTLTPPLLYVFQTQKDLAEAYGPSHAMEIVRRVWAHLQPRIGDQLGSLPNPGPLPTA